MSAPRPSTGYRPTAFAWALGGVVALALLLPFSLHNGDHGDLPDSTSTGGSERFATLDGNPAASFMTIERLRIQRHLARVEAEMRARDVSHLPATQQAERARLLDVLAEYRERGEFPRNLDFPGQLVPYFVDDRGVHCAVGYLLHRSGRDDVVEHVADTRNHATVPELANEPALAEWLDRVGITLEEAAEIQPTYCGMDSHDGGWWCPPQEPEPERRSLDGGYLAAGIGVAALEAAGLGLNLASLRNGQASECRGALAVATGAAGVGLGIHGVQDPGDRRTAGFVHLAVGLVTAGSGIHALLSRVPGAGEGDPFGHEDPDEVRDEAPAAAGPRAQQGYRLEVNPLLQEQGGERRVGLGFRLRH